MKKQLAAAAIATTALLSPNDILAADPAVTTTPELNITLNVQNTDGQQMGR